MPILNFWSVVLYDNDTRGMIINPQGKTEVNSRQPLVKNKDGSVRLVFGPKKPDVVPEGNWIQTNPKKGWFTYSAGTRRPSSSSIGRGRWGTSSR